MCLNYFNVTNFQKKSSTYKFTVKNAILKILVSLQDTD